MGTTTCLQDSVSETHERLGARATEAHKVAVDRGLSRRGCPPIDLFVGETARHLHAVDNALIGSLDRRSREERTLAHDYLASAHELELVLFHVKAHEYGSVYERTFEWPAVWADVDRALAGEREAEVGIAEQLSARLDDERLTRLTGRLARLEPLEPSRPHPFTPRRGLAGAMARLIMRRTDEAMDAVESRYRPPVASRPHRSPGPVAQYLLADPRFDEETTSD